ncbi:MAG TPA: family 20 glycosylhydrolase, partial [Opitutaceae bacterium]|nr:family 20 glycosylhydrolase [Opitutaceae bacterium]
MERLDFLLQWLPRYAEWGYEELYLHLEDAVEYPSLPGVARSDAFTHRQLGRLVAAARRAGIKVVPIVNLLGHTQYLIKTPELRDLNELRDAAGRPLAHGQICPRHPRTLEIAGKLLRDVAPFCTAGKVHVGLDESFHLGQCPRCRAEIAQLGMAGHFAGHVARLHALTQSLGLRLGLWADMLALLPAAIPLLPRDVIAYDWYYYPFVRHPRVELYNFAEADLATPLQARGIEYWGCPMNGAFRYEPLPVFGERLANILSWWKRCRRVGAGGFLITSWEANRLAIELTTTVDAAAASLWLEPEVDDPGEMLARGFARVFGSTKVARVIPNALRRLGDKPHHLSEVRRWARVALAGDKYAFAGYHRWQINDRWDVCAGRDGAAAYERELRALERICRSLLAGDSVARASCRWPGNHGRDARAIHRLQAGSYRS